MPPENLFKGLADPTRLRITMLLLDTELCVCDLMAVLQMPQSTVSRHMSRLKSSGIVVDRRAGKWVHYRLAGTESVRDLRDYLERNFSQLAPYRGDRTTLRRLLQSSGCAKVLTSEVSKRPGSKRSMARN